MAVLVNRIRADLGVAVAGFSFLAVFVVYGLAWMALSLTLPRATPDPGALLPGGALVGATIAGMQAVSQLYLPDRFDGASQLYGAIGATLVALGWFFIAGRATVLSMALNAVIYERFGSISQVAFALPGLRILRRPVSAHPELLRPRALRSRRDSRRRRRSRPRSASACARRRRAAEAPEGPLTASTPLRIGEGRRRARRRRHHR